MKKNTKCLNIFRLGAVWVAVLMFACVPCRAFNADTAFGVEFSGCVESIGVGLVTTTVAQSLVPYEFHLAGEGQPVTPLVARTSRCDGIAVDGDRAKAGLIVQIGVVIIPPEVGAFIDTYVLWYYTSDAKLAHHLQKLGVNAQHVPNMEYGYENTAGSTKPLAVTVRKPGDPTLELTGTVTPSPNPAGFFIANWWRKGSDGIVIMTTNVPSISIGGANLTLSTDANSAVGQLIGGSSAGFVILQQFNSFSSAKMEVGTAVP